MQKYAYEQNKFSSVNKLQEVC